jgi:hypothetical protein
MSLALTTTRENGIFRGIAHEFALTTTHENCYFRRSIGRVFETIPDSRFCPFMGLYPEVGGHKATEQLLTPREAGRVVCGS